MATFPTISSGSMRVQGALASESLAMYPATLAHSFITRVITFANDSEQRWTVRRELFAAILQFHDLDGYSLSVLVDFFRTMKGRYVDTALLNVFDITLGGVNYQWCSFDQDDLLVEVGQNERYSLQLSIKQLRPN